MPVGPRTKAKAIAITAILLVVAWFANPNCDWDTYEARVTDKQVKRVGDRDTYFIYTVDAKGEPHVFKDVDAKWLLKFDSSDVYAVVEVGRWYRFKTIGWRWSLKSWYENVRSARAIDPPVGATPN
jgi:hypothetical protein